MVAEILIATFYTGNYLDDLTSRSRSTGCSSMPGKRTLMVYVL